jgi:chemotaxis protein methyltransferase CheR
VIERDMSVPVLEEILDLVHKHTGITMTEKKKTLLQGRLRPRLRELALETYQDYVAYFSAHPAEAQEFINLVTTNETFFFRTQRVWDYLEKELLPAWPARSAGKTLRLWSAASSSGEEAYSMAMLCREFQERAAGFAFSILATDISTEVLALAEKGVYQGRSIEDLKSRFPALVTRHFRTGLPESDAYQVRPELRAAVRFGTHSLFDPPKVKQSQDVVFLRNVLIYFSPSDQSKVMANIAEALVPGGILVLGESESLARFETPFEFVAPLIYRLPERR